jgi:hypothetical protein
MRKSLIIKEGILRARRLDFFEIPLSVALSPLVPSAFAARQSAAPERRRRLVQRLSSHLAGGREAV